MSRGARIAILAVTVVAVIAMSDRLPATPPDSVARPGDDIEIAWAAVPSSDRRHGEVRLVRRGPSVVVQTVLFSTVLRQVLGRIADKEDRNWGESTVGGADSRVYVAALREVLPELGGSESPASDADRHRSLVIEFVLAPDEDVVVLGDPAVARGSNERLTVSSVRTLRVLDLGRPYVRANMERILEDSFDVSRSEAAAMLRAASPNTSDSAVR